MASITNESGGRRTIQFVAPDGSRKSVRLGKVSRRQAEATCARIEQLQACRKTGQPHPADLKAWIESTDDTLHARLVATGLITQRHRRTLGAFVDAYIESRVDAKESTRTVYKRARRHLVNHFGADRQLRDITQADADAFALVLRANGLAEATARRTVGIAKQFFIAAERAELIAVSPFANLPSAVPANPSRAYFVTRDEIERVLAVSADPEWRLLIALGRYAALRVPSEPLRMLWRDVDLAGGRIRIESPKTEHHAAGKERWLPVFPELRRFFEESRNGAHDDAPVITQYRENSANLRTRLMRDIQAAGLEPWPKLWQNMRASRETELVEQFPAHVVAAWVGHTVAVAEKHYLQVTESHFERAQNDNTANNDRSLGPLGTTIQRTR